MAVFVQDPESRLAELGVRLSSFFDARRPARLEPAYRVRVNHELFYFADEAERRRFLSAPPRYTGPLTDPVEKIRFVPEPASPRAGHGGVTYYFLSDENRAAFVAEPDSFATPKFHMMMPDSGGRDL